ncbi:MAG: hypothetical protein AAFR67_08385 [Chloroflexota bacterium]
MPAMQTCTKCEETKSVEDFSWKNKEAEMRQTQCKACHAEYRRQHYQANKEKYKAKARRWNRANMPKHRARLRRYVFEYLLEHPCVDCGETNPIMLEFDHVRGRKSENVSVLISTATSIKRLKAEMSKCDVRCMNCHRLKTAKEGGWHILELMAEYGIDT